MHKKLYVLVILAVSHLLFTACTENSSPKFEIQNFTSIFDNNQFNASYFPIDMRQTADGGYLVIGGRRLTDSNFSGIYLLKADKFGNFVKEVEVEETHVNAIAKLTEIQSKFYFFCMDAFTQQAQLVEIDGNLESEPVFKSVGSGLTYPSVATFDTNNFLLLSYNNADKETVISFVNTDGGVQASKAYSIGVGDDVEEPIINHYIRTGRQFPFEVGKASNGVYFFNGFYNYTFSLVFTDFTTDNPPVVQGQQDDGGLSAVVPINGNKFAAARFNFGDNFLLPNVNLETNGISTSIDLGGLSLPELVPNAKVKILRVTLNNKNVLIYGSDTKSKQIGLLFYNEADGSFISSRYLGFSNPFEIASLIQTADEGLAVCGTTYIAGRFPRICIFKLSKEELSGNIN